MALGPLSMHLTLSGAQASHMGKVAQLGLPGRQSGRGWAWSWCVDLCARMRPLDALRPGLTGWPKGHLEHITMNGLVPLPVLAGRNMAQRARDLNWAVSLCWVVLSPVLSTLPGHQSGRRMWADLALHGPGEIHAAV